MLYIIGLGLSEKGYSKEAYEAIKECKKIYLEGYTVDFPYKIKNLEKEFNEKIEVLDRDKVEDLSLVKEAKKEDVCLLVYGAPLSATTHITLIQEAKKAKTKVKIMQGASVFDAIAESGLQLYKFGKTTSIPKFEAESFGEIIKENLSINAHTLLLVDIGLDLDKALDKLENSAKKYGVDIQKIIVCSKLGNKNSKICYGNLSELKSKKMEKPFCIIVPGKMHFVEEEFLKSI
ncbi:MAG: diphthine synthase [Nanoarchaeota archaeon]